MKGLTKAEIKQFQEHKAALRTATDKVDEAISNFEERAALLFDEIVTDSTDELDHLIDKVNAWIEKVRIRLREVYDSHSEKWQEGDKGQAFDTFKDEWDYTDLDPPCYELGDCLRGGEDFELKAFNTLPIEPEETF